ncbi:V-type proton ATPase subunit a [Operophtera brumata]|uniref:V-type proton ATPase subunit a n=1 Tax=Operophtera brumata TaxID=104452 RepID=A0A0L7L819_OPEBR|nr:V-type proton ATPase subunit a [Operophtera brumata]
MGSLFRSEEMTLCQLFLQSEAAYACVSELGELGLVQFRDLNPDVNAFQRKFVNEVRRCDEMERKLRYLEKEIRRDGIPMLEIPGECPEAPQPREMIDLEATFEKLENELREVNQNAEALKRNFLELTELKHILRKTQVFFDEMADPSREEEQVTLLGEEGLMAGGQALKLGYALLYTTAPDAFRLPLQKSKHVTERYYFCSACTGTLIPESTDHHSGKHWSRPHEGGASTTESMTRALISDDPSRHMGHVQLGFVAGVILRERIPAFERMLWRACRGNVFLRQSEIDTPLEDPSSSDQVYKSVFIIFFQGDQLKTRVKKICEGFRATLYPCPESASDRREMAMGVMTRIEDLNTVLGQTQDHRHRVLVAAAKNIKNWFVKVRKIKAIYHTLNLFNLDVTQKCLIAECWERSGSSVPPILNRMETPEDPPTYNRTSKFTSAFQNLIYAYGVATYRESLNIFGSSWRGNYNESTLLSNKMLQLNPDSDDYLQTPYTFGIDPVWQLAQANKIIFMNAYKMKISIIIDVVKSSAYCAPSILITFINMVLFKDDEKPRDPCDITMFAGQKGLQKVCTYPRRPS